MNAWTLAIFVSCFLLFAQANFCPTRNLTAIEEKRRCRKPCSTPEDCGSSPNKTCQCDGVCGMSCFNKRSKCQKPVGIENGAVKWNHLRWGGTAYYSCNESYTLNGTRTRQCHSDRQWSGSAPTCELDSELQPHELQPRGECQKPRNTAFSYMPNPSNNYFVGESYRFSCTTGHYMVGTPYRTCTSNGWTNALFVCSPAECDPLRHVPYGEIVFTKGLKFGSVASLRCNEGYSSTSPGQKARCYPGERGSAYGIWRGVLPSCEIINCGEPIVPNHGTIPHHRLVDPTYGTVIEYDCDEGYKIIGPREGRCNEKGDWGEEPLCVENFDCDFSDSVCGYNNIGWSPVEFSSDSSRNFVLQSDRGNSVFAFPRIPEDWSYVCLAFNYKLPTHTQAHEVLTVEGSQSRKVYWRTLSGERTGTWHSSEVSIRIPFGRSFQFHATQESVLIDDIVVVPGECKASCQNITCFNGATCYNKDDDFYCFCEEGFYGDNCENEITCNTRSPGENSYLVKAKPRWVYGDEAQYVCNAGYYNRDPDTLEEIPTSITCRSDGTWSSSPPNCFTPFCIFTDNHEIGPFAVFSKSMYHVNETVLLVCPPGYYLSGGSLLRCQSMLTWDRQLPTCERISCGRLPRVSHSSTTRTPDLQYAQYFDFRACDSGYYMEGQRRVTCRFDGSFSRLPTCKKIRPCIDTFPPLKNGRKLMQRKVVNFQCNFMYLLEGEGEIHCRNDGTWEHPAPYCREREPSNRMIYENLEYLIFTDPSLKSAYPDAQTRCGNLNGNLAVLYNNEVTQKLEEFLYPLQEQRYRVYIGLKSRSGSEFEWDLSHLKTSLEKWKKESRYRNWQWGSHNRPDNMECAVMERRRVWLRDAFAWTTTGCWEKNYFICQRDFVPCTPNCFNGGRCSRISGAVSCLCQSGYKGSDCSEEIRCSIKDLASNIITEHRASFVRMGEEIPIKCKDGYRLVGSGKIMCERDGRWNNQIGKCREITCGGLQVPEGVMVKNPFGLTAESTALFYCADDFRFEGYAAATCGLDGKWSNVTAACKVTKCESPNLPDRMYIKRNTDEFPSGTSVTLNCLGGRYLNGSPSLRCEEGRWSPLTAECIIQYCKIDVILLRSGLEVAEVPLSQLARRNFEIGDQLTFRCRNRNKKVTDRNLDDVSPVITCQRGGRWSPSYTGFTCSR